jgi:hypothetical protein
MKCNSSSINRGGPLESKTPDGMVYIMKVQGKDRMRNHEGRAGPQGHMKGQAMLSWKTERPAVRVYTCSTKGSDQERGYTDDKGIEKQTPVLVFTPDVAYNDTESTKK